MSPRVLQTTEISLRGFFKVVADCDVLRVIRFFFFHALCCLNCVNLIATMFNLKRGVTEQYQTMAVCGNRLTVFLFVISLCFVRSFGAITEDNCEVCVKLLRKFDLVLTDEIRKVPTQIEESFKSFCLDTKGKDNRFCYYIGGMPDSATYILAEMSKPLSWNMPVEKVCEKLHKKDSQICELRYDKQIDLKTVDLKRLKVRDLKKILDTWGEVCDGCIEKTDFIKLIQELTPKYVKEEL